MKKILMYFIGILLLLATFATLYFAGALFDATGDRKINTFIMQPDNLSSERIGRPVALEKLSNDFIRERLTRRFIREYFYVIPDTENAAIRTRSDSVMAALSSPDVFNEWKRATAADIEQMAAKKIMRDVEIDDGIVQKGDYWEVLYTLRTWGSSNDMELIPETERGIMHLKIVFEPGLRETRGGVNFNIPKYLKSGGDPAAIFKFRVEEVK